MACMVALGPWGGLGPISEALTSQLGGKGHVSEAAGLGKLIMSRALELFVADAEPHWDWRADVWVDLCFQAAEVAAAALCTVQAESAGTACGICATALCA